MIVVTFDEVPILRRLERGKHCNLKFCGDVEVCACDVGVVSATQTLCIRVLGKVSTRWYGFDVLE